MSNNVALPPNVREGMGLEQTRNRLSVFDKITYTCHDPNPWNMNLDAQLTYWSYVTQ